MKLVTKRFNSFVTALITSLGSDNGSEDFILMPNGSEGDVAQPEEVMERPPQTIADPPSNHVTLAKSGLKSNRCISPEELENAEHRARLWISEGE